MKKNMAGKRDHVTEKDRLHKNRFMISVQYTSIHHYGLLSITIFCKTRKTSVMQIASRDESVHQHGMYFKKYLKSVMNSFCTNC